MEGGGDHQYLLGDPLAPFPQLQDGGGIWTDYLSEYGNSSGHGGAEDLFDLFRLLNDDDDDSSLGAKQPDADSSGSAAGANDYVVQDPSLLMGYLPAAGMCHAWPEPEQSPELGDDQPVAPLDATTTVQVPAEPAAAADILTATTELDDEMEIAEMVHVAARCGEDDDRTLWSEEEHNELLARLDLYAEDDAVTRCFKIAFHLPKKTALDVALRCRWLQDKRETAQKTELAQKDSASGEPVKAKGTKIAKFNNKIYPLSKEALNSKSNKELIKDNDMFLKRIEEDLKTGQLSTADYFYYVKTNMDVIEERGSKLGVRMAMPPIDEHGLEEILRDRVNSLAWIEDA